MTTKRTVARTLELAVDALNAGDPVRAAGLALQALQEQPQNRDALMILGTARFVALCNPHDVFFTKLKAIGFRPKTAVDIGAYEGEWTLALKRSFPETRVLMIEAQSDTIPALKAITDSFADATYRTCLVGDRMDDVVPFHVMDTPYGTSTGSSIYPEQTRFSRNVVKLEMKTLDRILAGSDMAAPDLLKIDVQGAELDVLKGAVNALKTVEFIHMELSTLQYNAGAPLIADVLPHLEMSGFVLFDILDEHRGPNQMLLQLDALFVRKGSAFRPTGILF